MSRKHRQDSLEEIVRSLGAPPPPTVDAMVPEVRSCMHIIPPALAPNDLLGGFVIMWDFTLSLSDVQSFHDFLRKEEKYIADSLKKLAGHPVYRGTYMLQGPGDPRYRTIWGYESAASMAKLWSTALRVKTSHLYRAVVTLRGFWLLDPQRSDTRWAPANFFFDPKEDHGDAFAKLTLDAAKLVLRKRSR
jgi:hypothetical protein